MRLRPIIGWAVFFFIAVIVVQALPSSPRATFYFFKGHQKLSAHDFEGAVAAFNESVESDPGFARGFVDLGSAYLALQKYPEAESALKQAMTIKADSCAACGLGMLYRVQGRRDEAEKFLRTSTELDPKDPCALNQLGRMYYDEKDYPKAVEAFEQLISLQRNAVSLHFLANSLHHSGKVVESLHYYTEARHLKPNYEELLVDLGNAYHDLGRNTHAVEAFERAIKLDPDDEKARAFLGVTQFEMGNRKEAMEHYGWLQGKNPKLAAELLQSYRDLSIAERKTTNQILQ